jgi:hypothetical protein
MEENTYKYPLKGVLVSSVKCLHCENVSSVCESFQVCFFLRLFVLEKEIFNIFDGFNNKYKK